MKVWVVLRHYEFDAVFMTKEAAEKYVLEMDHTKDLYNEFQIIEEEVRR